MGTHKMKSKSSGSRRSQWLAEVPVGCLVSPRKMLYLTPTWDDEANDWPKWEPFEVGMVLDPVPGQIGVRVLAPGGSGLCFADEIFVHWDPTKDQ